VCPQKIITKLIFSSIIVVSVTVNEESEKVKIRIARLVTSDIRPVRLYPQNEFMSDTIPSVVTSIVCKDTVQLSPLSSVDGSRTEQRRTT